MTEEVQSDNSYALSDEEILQQDLSLMQPTEVVVTTQPETVATEVVPEAAPEVDVPDTEVETQEPATEVETETETPEETDPSDETDETQAEVDYKAFYDSVTKPFVANGKELQVTKAEDMVRLMQQGAGYHKKMAELKPLKRLNKLLEDNQLLDETQLGFVIDLHNKKPEAIAKLIKESGIDLYDFNTDVADSYVPQAPQVAETNEALDAVLQDLQSSSPTYVQTISVIGNDWDDSSRTILAEHPQLIRSIDQHMQDGTFDKIQQRVEYERTLGRLAGVSDLQAYKQVGDMLFGGNAAQQPQQAQAPVTQAPTIPSVVPTKQPLTQAQSIQKKKAAAAPKAVATVSKPQIDTQNMTDEQVLASLSAQ